MPTSAPSQLSLSPSVSPADSLVDRQAALLCCSAVQRCLDNEDALRQLLACLPVATLLRCEALSRQWRRLVHERYYELVRFHEDFRPFTYACELTVPLSRLALRSASSSAATAAVAVTAAAAVAEKNSPRNGNDDRNNDNKSDNNNSDHSDSSNNNNNNNNNTAVSVTGAAPKIAPPQRALFPAAEALPYKQTLLRLHRLRERALHTAAETRTQTDTQQSPSVSNDNKNNNNNNNTDDNSNDDENNTPSPTTAPAPSATPAVQRDLSGLLLYGALSAECASSFSLLEDSPGVLRGRIQEMKDFFPGDSLTAVASVYDPQRRAIFAFGGWDEQSERTLRRTMRLSLQTLLSYNATQEKRERRTATLGFHHATQIITAPALPKWTAYPRECSLTQKTCFASATMVNVSLAHTHAHDTAPSHSDGQEILLTGGGLSPYRISHTDVYRSCMLFNPDTGLSRHNVVPDMLSARCGHASVSLYDGRVLVAGGYGGDMTYYNTVELFDWESQRWLSLPPMHCARSCPALCLGPYGCVYIAGGSPDGESGQRSCERYDPREGFWESLPEMALPRGYTHGAYAPSGVFYVAGGVHEHRRQGGLEAFDVRAGRWHVVSDSTLCVRRRPRSQRWRNVDFPPEEGVEDTPLPTDTHTRTPIQVRTNENAVERRSFVANRVRESESDTPMTERELEIERERLRRELLREQEATLSHSLARTLAHVGRETERQQAVADLVSRPFQALQQTLVAGSAVDSSLTQTHTQTQTLPLTQHNDVVRLWTPDTETNPSHMTTQQVDTEASAMEEEDAQEAQFHEEEDGWYDEDEDDLFEDLLAQQEDDVFDGRELVRAGHHMQYVWLLD